MNQKTFIKIGQKIFNLMSIDMIEISEADFAVNIETGHKTHKYKFADEKEFNRFKEFVRLFSTEFKTVSGPLEIAFDSAKEILT